MAALAQDCWSGRLSAFPLYLRAALFPSAAYSPAELAAELSATLPLSPQQGWEVSLKCPSLAARKFTFGGG